MSQDGESPADTEDAEKDKAEETDADGWVYGDNKWESHRGKGGLDKVSCSPLVFVLIFSAYMGFDLVAVHALPLLDLRGSLDRDNRTCRAWTHGRFV